MPCSRRSNSYTGNGGAWLNYQAHSRTSNGQTSQSIIKSLHLHLFDIYTTSRIHTSCFQISVGTRYRVYTSSGKDRHRFTVLTPSRSSTTSRSILHHPFCPHTTRSRPLAAIDYITFIITFSQYSTTTRDSLSVALSWTLGNERKKRFLTTSTKTSNEGNHRNHFKDKEYRAGAITQDRIVRQRSIRWQCLLPNYNHGRR